jgi:glutamate-1-semialdehyde 2,1-aminomutase
MGGGFPVAALGGKKEIMSLVASGKVSVAGTYSGNGIAMAATEAALGELSKPGAYKELWRVSDRLSDGLRAIWAKSPIKTQIVGLGPLFQIWFSEKPIHNYREAAEYADHRLFRIWWEEMLVRGILFHPHAFENLFVSMAHTDADIDATLVAAEEAAAAVARRAGA